MAFDPSQAGMAIFLLFAALFNGWFVFRSYVRSFPREPREATDNAAKPSAARRYNRLLPYSVLGMALFDIPWVWLCMIQCWNNMLTSPGSNALHQDAGDDSFGCKFMGWYSSFSLVSMMGSHCIVAFYLLKRLNEGGSGSGESNKVPFLGRTAGFLALELSLLVAAVLFGSMPLMGDAGGYRLTNGGFCYADFTNRGQAGVILFVVLAFLSLSTALWVKIGRWADYWPYFVVFFCTWILWVPACAYGIATGQEIDSPYMIIGAVIGHSNALINPLLYGVRLFGTIEKTESDKREDNLLVKTAKEVDVV